MIDRGYYSGFGGAYLPEILVATFDELEDAGRAVSQIMHSGIIPSALEILGRHTILAINQNTDLNLPEIDAMLLVETDGYTKEETDFQMEKILGQDESL